MNQKQRKILFGCAQRLERIESEISSIIEAVEDVKNEEEDKLDNLPDSLRESSKGEGFEESIERLDEILSLLEDKEYSDAVDLLNEF